MRKHKLYVKMSRSPFFFRNSVDFLGHVVSAEGVQVDPKKVLVTSAWPPLPDKHAVQQFRGLGNYFFIYGPAQ